MFVKLARSSMFDRLPSVVLSVLAISVAVFVLLAIEQIRMQSKKSFTKTVSGVDLIVGQKTGDIGLLLSSIFGIGMPDGSVSWRAYEKISEHKSVAWSIPIALGDSHRGFRVMATSVDFFEHFKFGQNYPLTFQVGERFSGLYDAVIGAEIAETLAYSLGDSMTLSHGLGDVSFAKHDQSVFSVVGVLSPTGSPVDRTIFVSLKGLDATHGIFHQQEHEGDSSHRPHTEKISVFMLGLKNKSHAFLVQGVVNRYTEEPLKAILPGVALVELWKITGTFEKILQLIAVLVLITSLLGMSSMLLATIRERRAEIFVLRILGARPYLVFGLIQLEAFSITAVAVLMAIIGLYGVFYFAEAFLAQNFGLYLSRSLLLEGIVPKTFLIVGVSLTISLVPAFSAYRLAKE